MQNLLDVNTLGSVHVRNRWTITKEPYA